MNSVKNFRRFTNGFFASEYKENSTQTFSVDCNKPKALARSRPISNFSNSVLTKERSFVVSWESLNNEFEFVRFVTEF